MRQRTNGHLASRPGFAGKRWCLLVRWTFLRLTLSCHCPDLCGRGADTGLFLEPRASWVLLRSKEREREGGALGSPGQEQESPQQRVAEHQHQLPSPPDVPNADPGRDPNPFSSTPLYLIVHGPRGPGDITCSGMGAGGWQ